MDEWLSLPPREDSAQEYIPALNNMEMDLPEVIGLPLQALNMFTYVINVLYEMQ